MSDALAQPPSPVTDPLDRLAYVIATWFGVGWTPLAPGTAGSAVAALLFVPMRALGLDVMALLVLLLTGAGVWATQRIVALRGGHDPQFIVVDEVAGQWLTLLVVPADWRWYLAGFVMFRLCDQFKPWPARQAERELPPAWGVMLDDIFAGAWGAVLLWLAQRWVV